MNHPLQYKIWSVGRRVKLIALLCGFGRVVTWSAVAIFLIGSIDYLFVVRDIGVRIIGSLFVLSVITWTARQFYWRYWIPVWGDLDLARSIEKHFPAFDDRLSSSVIFLRQNENDDATGSAELRRAVIVQANRDVQQLNPREVINYRPAVRAVASVCLMLLVAGILVLVAPLTTTRALRRMAVPWSAESWNRLIIVEASERVTKGDDFFVRAADRQGNMPRSVRVQYWFDGDRKSTIREELMIYEDGVVIHQLSSVTRSFQFRVLGGDDDSMPWRSVEVVEPPAVASFEVRVNPPVYTGWSASMVQPPMRVLEGSSIEIHGTTTIPVSVVKVRVETADVVAAYSPELLDNGKTFVLTKEQEMPWNVEDSCAFWFELVGPDGMISGRGKRYEVEVWTHHAPRVSVRGLKSHEFVTPQALISFVADVQDAVAIHSVQLHVLRADQADSEETVLEMYRATEMIRSDSKESTLTASMSPERREIEYHWDLSDSSRLVPGDKLEFFVVAANPKPASGQSDRQRLTIISTDELLDRLAQRQRFIVNQIGDTLRQQRVARAQNEKLEIQIRDVGLLRGVDFDSLRSLNFVQSEVGHRFHAEEDGFLVQVSSVIEELKRNRIDGSQIGFNLSRLRTSLTTVYHEHLEPIDEQLVIALQHLRIVKQESNASDRFQFPETSLPAALDGVRRGLHEVAQHQDQAITTLEALYDEFSNWNTYHQFAFDLRQLFHDQEQVSQQTEELRWRTISKKRVNVSAQERADYRKVSLEQNQLAHQLDRIQGRMDDVLNQVTANEDKVRHAIADALEIAVQTTLSNSMRDASRTIDVGQTGNALILQQQIEAHLEEMIQVLTHRGEHESKRLVKKLRQSANELAEVMRDQKELKKKIEMLAESSNGLNRSKQLQHVTERMRVLRREVERLSRKLERLQVQRAAGHLEEASSHLQDTAQANRELRLGDAATNARYTEKDLESAQRQLKASIRSAEQESIREEMVELEDQLKGLLDRQNRISADIRRLEEIRQDQGSWTDGQRNSLASSIRNQRDVVDEIHVLADRLRDATVLHFALIRVGEPAGIVVTRLKREITDHITQESAEVAAARLSQLYRVVQEKEDRVDRAEEGAGEGDGAGSGDSGGQSRVGIAELRLLKIMQDEVNLRTKELEQQRLPIGAENEREPLRSIQLAEQQSRLAALVLSIFQTERSNSEDLPELVPNPDEKDDGDRDAN